MWCLVRVLPAVGVGDQAVHTAAAACLAEQERVVAGLLRVRVGAGHVQDVIAVGQAYGARRHLESEVSSAAGVAAAEASQRVEHSGADTVAREVHGVRGPDLRRVLLLLVLLGTRRGQQKEGEHAGPQEGGRDLHPDQRQQGDGVHECGQFQERSEHIRPLSSFGIWRLL